MSWKILYITLACLAVNGLAGAETGAETTYPEVTEEGLRKVGDTDLSLVYAMPGVDMSIYREVRLLDATVAFRKNWQRDQNRMMPFKVDARDMDRIRTDLKEQFRQVFTAELTEGGYTLTTETGDDVLVVRPAIVNLDIRTPDVRSNSRIYQFAESAGEMTLYLELYDSVTGALIAKALDRKKDRDRGYFQWQTRVTNRAAANRILKAWAETLRETLDQARGITREE